MSAALLARAGFRRNRRALLGLSVVMALGFGVALASLEAATRTRLAYPSYLRQAEVGDMVINPSLITDRAQGLIAATPGVRSLVSDSLLTATVDDGHPRSQAEIDGDLTQVRVSTDGRYTSLDRPVVLEGRMIKGGAEAFVSVETAEALAIEVGDSLPLAFWVPGLNQTEAREPSTVQPVGRAEASVVGIGVFADEVLVDELYPRRRILVTPEIGSPVDCTLAHPRAGDPRSMDELAQALTPAGCSMSYRYYSLRLDGGDEAVGRVTEALATRFAEANLELPPAMRAADVGFAVIASVTSEERQRVQRSLGPAVTALELFAAASGASSLVIIALGALRIIRRDERETRIWNHLGVVRAARATALAVPLVVASVAGLWVRWQWAG